MRVFVINNEQIAHTLFKNILSRFFPMATAECFSDGLEAWPSICGSIEGGEDVAVITCTEYKGSEMTGFDLVRTLKELEAKKERRIPVAITSGYGASVAREAMESGADIFISTPCDFPVLVDRFRELLFASAAA